MTRRQANKEIEAVLRNAGCADFIEPEEILVALDEALDLEPEIVDLSGVAYGRSQ